MVITAQQLNDFIRDSIGVQDTLESKKQKTKEILKERGARIDPQFHLMVALYYQRLLTLKHTDTEAAAYYSLAEASLKEALRLSKNDPGYLNQINYQLGLLYHDRSKLDSTPENQRLAVKHFQAVDITFREDRVKVSVNQLDNDDVEYFCLSRLQIAEIYQSADSVELVRDMEFKGNKKLVRNDINAIVARIEVYVRSYEYNSISNAILEQYIDLQELARGSLVFKPNSLTLVQAYKIARLCKDKKLVSPKNYLNILWNIEAAVENDETLPGKHLRKKTRYQLLTTLNDLYKKNIVNLEGFNTLYQKLMAKIGNFRLALLARDNKAQNVKRFMDQVVDKGIAPLYKRRRANNYSRDYTPIVGPIDHLVNTFNVVSAITRPLGKWPLFIVGSILDIVLIIPLLCKLITPLLKNLLCGCVHTGRSKSEINWANSWFTGLLGTVIGEGIIGLGGGAILSLALTAAIYPIRLAGSILRRIIEAISRSYQESKGSKRINEDIEKSRPLNNQHLDQEALRTALDQGIELDRKPTKNYLQDKEFKLYKTPQSYLSVFKFLGKPDATKATAPPMHLADHPFMEEVGTVPIPSAPLYQANEEALNPYLVPPSYNY